MLTLTACSLLTPDPTTTSRSAEVSSPPVTSIPSDPVSTVSTTTTSGETATTVTPLYSAAITAVTRERLGHSWHRGCPVDPKDLRLLTVTYWDFDGGPHDGDLIVNVSEAEKLAGVFATLFEIRYPIVSMIPIGDLDPDAEEQSDYDNTSGFNCRFVAGTTRWSEHAKGLAIDLNVMQNPFIEGDQIWPENATVFVDRTLDEPGMIKDGDAVVTAFESIGWAWGGYWTSLKDYQHFSLTGT